MILAADDTESSARVATLAQALQQLGWTADRNVQIEYRWGADSADQAGTHAAELVALAPDPILTVGSPGGCEKNDEHCVNGLREYRRSSRRRLR